MSGLKAKFGISSVVTAVISAGICIVGLISLFRALSVDTKNAEYIGSYEFTLVSAGYDYDFFNSTEEPQKLYYEIYKTEDGKYSCRINSNAESYGRFYSDENYRPKITMSVWKNGAGYSCDGPDSTAELVLEKRKTEKHNGMLKGGIMLAIGAAVFIAGIFAKSK